MRRQRSAAKGWIRRDAEREQELQRVPHQTIDKSKWSKAMPPISIDEIGGIGIDADGWLH
jgi:hypothetical protein